ncbi:flagellar basal body rod protein FlgC [Thermoproteota archaeon]
MRTFISKIIMLITSSVLFFTAGSSVVSAQGLDDAFEISASGMLTQKIRITLIAENIANMSSLKDEETGLPYQRQYAVIEPTAKGVRVSSIEKSKEPFGKYFDPSVPQADEDGYFYYPNVTIPEEMVNLTYSEAIFEANVACFKTTKAIYQSTIDVLK